MARKEVEEPAKAARSTMNMTPMIDVTFQLIVVFLCSLKFRTLDQKIEAFLPEPGMAPVFREMPVESRLTVRLRRAAGAGPTEVVLLDGRVGTTAEGEAVWTRLEARIREIRGRDASMKGEIDAGGEVPHGEVIRALDAFLAADLGTVLFRGAPPRAGF